MQALIMSEAKPLPTSRPIFVVSDGTGDTGAAVARAALAQFQVECKLRRFGGIRQPSLARRVVAEAERVGALVLFTLVDRRVAQGLLEEAATRGVPTLEDRKSTRLNSSHLKLPRMPSSA